MVSRQNMRNTILKTDAILAPVMLMEKYEGHDGEGEHPVFTYQRWLSATTRHKTHHSYWQWVSLKIDDALDDIHRRKGHK